LSERCRALLRGEETLALRRDPQASSAAGKRTGSRRASIVQQSLDPAGYRLWEALRGLRRQLAQEQDVPPYVIFHDATLMEMVLHRPHSLEQMRRLSGVGQRKLELYGKPFLALIAATGQPAGA
jgi:ATP-dependent DNA helicase RecQ